MGGTQITVQNLRIVDIDSENQLLLIAGSVPGPKNNVLEVSVSLKKGQDKDLNVTKKTAKEETKPELKTEEPVVIASDAADENNTDNNANE